jgi:hypothetical protein
MALGSIGEVPKKQTNFQANQTLSTFVFRPMLSVNFFIRFDEAMLRSKKLAGLPPGKDPPGTIPTRTEEVPSDVPLVFSGPDGSISHIFAAVPKQASIELPGYRQAGKFSFTFNFRDLPFDPRTIRSLEVNAYLASVTPQQFLDSASGREPYGTLQNTVREEENLVISGLVDTISTTFDNKGSELKMDGRDFRGMFLDARLSKPEVLNKLNLKQPIDKVISDFLSKMPFATKINVVTAPVDQWPGKVIPSVGAQEILTRINQGANGQQANKPSSGTGTGLNFWDVITSMCFLVGCIPYFSKNVLMLRPARSLYDQALAGDTDNPSPFAGGAPRDMGKNGNGYSQKITYRRMVYGRNIEKMSMERKLAGNAKVPTVRLVSTDTGSAERGMKRLIEARYPPEKGHAAPSAPDDALNEAAVATDVAPDGTAKEEILTIPAYGIRDKKRLLMMAQAVYEEIGRGEVKGSVSTKDLTSIAGDASDTDLLRIRPGDAVQLLVDSTGQRSLPAIVSDLSNLAAMSNEEAVATVAARFGGDKKLAQVLVYTMRDRFNALQTTFRVNTVKFSWDVAKGLGVDFDFHNFIEARNDLQNLKDSVPSRRIQQTQTPRHSVGHGHSAGPLSKPRKHK